MTRRRLSTGTKRSDDSPLVVALGLGSNTGDREANLQLAVRSLTPHLEEIQVSSPFHTQPLHETSQPAFLNAAVVATCSLSAEDLLGLAKGLEWLAGRRPGPRYGPRPLDVDILVYGDRRIRRPELIIPHPLLRQRAFVLAPLSEIAPHLPIPPDGARVIDLLSALGDDQGVEKQSWSLRRGKLMP